MILFKIDWQAHKIWVGLVVLAAVLAYGNGPFIGMAQQRAQQRLDLLRRQQSEAETARRQLQEDLQSAEKMKTQINAVQTRRLLEPVDRLKAAQILERRAAEAHLSAFTYTLSPETPTAIALLGAGNQTFGLSKWSVSASAPTDLDAYEFLDSIARTMPGRITLTQMTLQRIGSADQPLSDRNLRFTANGEWLSNAAKQILGERE